MNDRNIEIIRDNITLSSAYEQLAEEAVELAHAALKCARVIRQENPTPVKYTDALAAVNEEWTDVVTVCKVLNLRSDRKMMEEKLDRWCGRMLESIISEDLTRLDTLGHA